MLWMMFGCKYVNQTLEALGSDHADQRGIMQLLNDLQQMECLYIVWLRFHVITDVVTINTYGFISECEDGKFQWILFLLEYDYYS